MQSQVSLSETGEEPQAHRVRDRSRDCGDRSRDCSRRPGRAGGAELEEAGRILPWGLQREHSPAHALTLDSGLQENEFLLFEAKQLVGLFFTADTGMNTAVIWAVMQRHTDILS